jgi:DNA-binding response OmpR family regulator
MRRIAVIEDSEALGAAVAARLRAEGYDVRTATSGPAGVELCRRWEPDALVLDVMLPGFDGHEVCRRVQAERWVPVIMLTARDTEPDLVAGLGVGADDYLTKPFSMRELVARVAAVLRRATKAGAPADGGVLRAGALELDPEGHRAAVDGRPVRLTRREFDLLHHLARRPGRAVGREQLLVDVWGYADGTGARTVDTHVAALRRKVGPGWIRTVHGVGYAFEPEPGA